MDKEELKRFDEATEHPYECLCELCVEFWAAMPDEDDQPTKHCSCNAIPDENEKGGTCSSCGGWVEDESLAF